MVIELRRDSVCLADDIEAPHSERFEFEPTATVADLIRAVHDQNYLPSIAGGRATWVLQGESPLALICQQSPRVWPLTDLDRKLSDVLPSQGFWLDYRQQIAPNRIFRDLGGDPSAQPALSPERHPAERQAKRRLLAGNVVGWLVDLLCRGRRPR